jgi:hypothetical protein
MSRSRVVVLAALGVVAVGGALTLGALARGSARAAIGPLPAEALPILADARYVMGLDVARFYASSFHERYAGTPGSSPQALRELEAKTGIDPARDVDHVLAAGGAPGEGGGVALVQGRFDPTRIARAIESRKQGVTWKQHLGVTVYLFQEGSKSPGALAFLDDHLILLGAQRSVESVVARRLQAGPTGSSATIRGLVGRVRPGATFWVVGDETALAALQGAAARSGPSLALPALRSLVVTGDLDPEVRVSIVGDAVDAAGAKNVADVVRGLVGLVSLQASQKPALAQLASDVAIATEENQVKIEARIPYTVLDALAPKGRATPVPPEAER